MLKTYWKRKVTYYNDLLISVYGCCIICEDYQAVDTEIVYSGYDEIQNHVQEIPCSIYKEGKISSKKGEYLKLYADCDHEIYHIFKKSDAVIKIITLYSEDEPRLRDLANMKADLVFRYMAQFINNERRQSE